MKKLFISTAVLLLLLVGAWLGGSWFVGVETEKQARQYFQQTAGQHELISYQRSLLHSTAVTRLDVSQTPLGQWLDKLPLQHKITHGPVFWQSALKVAWLSWQSRLDRDALDETVQQQLAQTFGTEQPFQIEATVDFEQTTHYQLRLSPLRIEDEISELVITLNDLQLDGQFTQGQSPENFVATLRRLELENPEIKVAVPELNIQQSKSVPEHTQEQNVDQPEAAVLTEISWSADEVSALFDGETEPLRFKMAGQSGTHTENGQLSGELGLLLDQFTGLTYPLQNLDFRLGYGGLNVAVLTEINRLQNRLQDLQAQLGWQEVELELPEDRRQLFQLNVQLRETADQLLGVLFGKALQAEQSTLKTQLTLVTANGNMTSRADLSYAGTKQPVVLDYLMQAGLVEWLAFLRGDIELNIAKQALPPELELFLFYPLERRGLIESEDSFRMKLRLLEQDAELNGRVVAYEALAEQFLPPVIDAETEVPDDVWLLVEEQGFSEELLQQLEQRDDISAQTLELLRELQATTELLNKKN